MSHAKRKRIHQSSSTLAVLLLLLSLGVGPVQAEEVETSLPQETVASTSASDVVSSTEVISSTSEEPSTTQPSLTEPSESSTSTSTASSSSSSVIEEEESVAPVAESETQPAATEEKAVVATIIPLYRLYNPGLRVHLYTKDTNEYKILGTRGWNQEGLAWNTSGNQGDPVYRLYHPDLRVHLYTKDTNEYKVLAGRGWRQEGEAFRSYGTTPIYRLYHEGMKKHLYTKDFNEYTVLAGRGWRQEGIAFWGLGETSSPTPPPSNTQPSSTVPSTTVTKTQRRESIPYKTIRQADSNMWEGEEKVTRNGVDGYKVIEIITTRNNVTGQTETSEKVIESKPATDKIIAYGTKKRSGITTKERIDNSEIITFKTVTKRTDTLYEGETKVETEGKNGYVSKTYIDTYTNGKLTSSKLKSSTIVKAVDKVVLVGTKPITKTETTYTTEVVQFKTIEREDHTLQKGLTKVVTKGVNGSVTYKVVTTKNVKTGATLSVNRIVSSRVNPTDQVVLVGARVLEAGDFYFNFSTDGLTDEEKSLLPQTLYDFKAMSPSKKAELAARDDLVTYCANPNLFTNEQMKLLADTINVQELNEKFAVKLNEERSKKGLAPATYAGTTSVAQKVAEIRANEMAAHGSLRYMGAADGKHKRPDGSAWTTAFASYPQIYDRYSENAGESSGTFNIFKMTDTDYLAETFFTMWKNSPSHYATMMSKGENYQFAFSVGFGTNSITKANASPNTGVDIMVGMFEIVHPAN